MIATSEVLNYIGGEWRRPSTDSGSDVFNPATGELLARSRVDSASDVATAVQAAHAAFPEWRSTPAPAGLF